jgi:hypothetical protein
MDYEKDTPFGLGSSDDDKPKEECAIFGLVPSHAIQSWFF